MNIIGEIMNKGGLSKLKEIYLSSNDIGDQGFYALLHYIIESKN